MHSGGQGQLLYIEGRGKSNRERGRVEYSLFHTRWVHVLVRDQNPVVEKYISQACGLLYELLTNAILS